jgi:hypothetical protein
MANEWKQYKSRPHLLKMIAATAGISKKVDELREALKKCISAGMHPVDGIIDDDLRYLGKAFV